MQHTQPGAVRKLVLSSALKDDISGWEKQLDMAYRTFQVCENRYGDSLLTRSTLGLESDDPPCGPCAGHPFPRFRRRPKHIWGGEYSKSGPIWEVLTDIRQQPMRSYDIDTTGLRFLLDWREQDRTSPWKDLRVGVVQQEQRLVKLYDGPYTEAEEAFLRDVKALGKLAYVCHIVSDWSHIS